MHQLAKHLRNVTYSKFILFFLELIKRNERNETAG